jgi:adenylosuccinate synthase
MKENLQKRNWGLMCPISLLTSIRTTKKGIGPTYAEKFNRTGIRIGDLRDFAAFEPRLRAIVASARKRFDLGTYDVEAEIAEFACFSNLLLLL